MMRRIFIGLNILWLAGCVSTSVEEGMPGIQKMNVTETHLTQANQTLSWANFTPKQEGQKLAWHFASPLALSMNADGASVDIEPAQDQQVTLTVEGDVNTAVQTSIVKDAIALKFHPYHGGKVTLYLPKQTHYLAVMNMKNLTGKAGDFTYFSAAEVNTVQLASSQWMLEKLMLLKVQQADLEGISTPYLLTWIKDSGKIDLHGMMALRELNVWGSGPVNIYWVNSPIFTAHIKAMSKVLLGGTAQFANMDVAKASLLDAKYLRVKRLFVKTHDNSKAAVTALNSLNAKPSSESNIYYYAQPATLSRYYEDSGSVLYAGDAPPTCTLPDCPVPQRVLPG